MGRPLPSDLATPESETKEVILGMPGPWAEENLEPSDHYTTKVGGLPDWPMPAEEIDSELLKCGSCGGELGLVAQVYAPLTIRGIEIDERTLYIFGCPSSSCGISPLSWRTIRVQSSGSFQNSIRAAGSSTEASSSSAGELAREDSSERDSGSDHQHANEWWDDDTWGPGVLGREDAEENAFLAMEELETALLEAGYAAAVPSLTQNLDTEEETIAIHEDGGETDDPGLPALPCFYVYSQNESHPSRGSRAVSALRSIECSEEAAVRDDINRGEEAWEGEEYEHDRALSADRTYLKFKKRLDCYPEQCFRYCFRGNPLWANKDGGEPGVCSQCGGPRVYEMQLMPPLLYYLQQACKDLPSTSYSPNDWEWLTLIVFTCAQSCTPCFSHGNGEGPYGESKPWIMVEEATILQYES